MKKMHLVFLFLFAAAVTPFFTGCSSCGGGGHQQAQMTVIPTSVMFGNSGTCVGTGICNCLVDTTHKLGPGPIPVSFSVQQNQPGVLFMGFHMSDLTQNQPNQVPFFQGQTSYLFSTAFPLTDPMFASLGLGPNPCILPTSSSQLSINGDSVTDIINYSTSQTPVFVNTNISFSCQQPVFLPTTGPNSVPVTFMIQPGAPQSLSMCFSLAALQAAQPGQVQNFQGPASYAFPNAFPLLNNPIFAPLNITLPNASISPALPGQLKVNGDLVTDAITISTANFITTNVIFGNTSANGQCSNHLAGICLVSLNPVVNPGGGPNSIPVTFTVNPNVPQGLTVSFSACTLAKNQQAQIPLFKPGATSYLFSATFDLTDPVFAPLNLQGNNPNISQQSQSQLSFFNNNNTIVDAVTYNLQ